MKSKIEIHLDKIKHSKIRIFLFNRPVFKLILFVLISGVLSNISKYFFPGNITARTIIELVNILIVIYFVIAIIYIIKERFEYLLNPKNLWSLLFAYIFLIIIILVIFSTILNFIELSKLGYLTYGQCSDKYNPDLIASDPSISRNYFYFTAITFFSTGYGDICPMGFTKIFSIMVSFIGHVISVILVTLILNNYIRRTEKEK